MADLASIIIAVIGSNALLEIVRYLIEKSKKKNGLDDRFNAIEDKLIKNEKDSVRTQLLLLMSDYPERTDEIMEVGRHYFEDLNGNWYMTSIFKNWLDQEKIERPSWIKK